MKWVMIMAGSIISAVVFSLLGLGWIESIDPFALDPVGCVINSLFVIAWSLFCNIIFGDNN